MTKVAIIPARGGSKGIPKKNLINFCGKPLLAWSIEQALSVNRINSVWVSSDSEEILSVAQKYGANPILRPEALSNDTASSESAWSHALDTIGAAGINVSCIIGMQATSPLRETDDLDNALKQFETEKLDSLLSVVEIQDFFVWHQQNNQTIALNYDYKNRKPRQIIENKFLENGSFYIFKPHLLRENNNRLGGKIGMYVMDKYKMFQIDHLTDVELCSVVMKGYGLDKE